MDKNELGKPLTENRHEYAFHQDLIYTVYTNLIQILFSNQPRFIGFLKTSHLHVAPNDID